MRKKEEQFISLFCYTSPLTILALEVLRTFSGRDQRTSIIKHFLSLFLFLSLCFQPTSREKSTVKFRLCHWPYVVVVPEKWCKDKKKTQIYFLKPTGKKVPCVGRHVGPDHPQRALILINFFCKKLGKTKLLQVHIISLRCDKY